MLIECKVFNSANLLAVNNSSLFASFGSLVKDSKEYIVGFNPYIIY